MKLITAFLLYPYKKITCYKPCYVVPTWSYCISLATSLFELDLDVNNKSYLHFSVEQTMNLTNTGSYFPFNS